ncbi:alpha/beta hydrolase [Streptomyces iconiensis]|uniref:Alpha/beta hydrolase n=1 Tax=Streptomyces iconiensis TaxID=1384038 RepID=A0ABT6ZVA2_9ACTN|nr:alpha/beta hydrolase [Streptomyces iconiensis]MDJ1132993.1 alpha/beta hydrolase [Streptomyces iconiensis]
MRRGNAGRTVAVGVLAGAAAFAALPVPAQADTVARATVSASPAATGDLHRFVQQRPRWTECGHKELDKAGARCASIRVPLDYRDPQGRTLRIGFSRIKATDTRHRIGLMMHNSGGPGGPTLDMPLLDAPVMGKRLAARYDLIGMDPRGVGRSSPVHCGTSGHWLRSAGYDTAGFRAQSAYSAQLVEGCRRAYGKGVEHLRHFTTRNTARDMDLLRAVLGERKTSYYGISYGTYLGAVYAKMFPGRTDRLLLDSAVDPARWSVRTLRDAAGANEEFLDAWAKWTAHRDRTYGLGGTPAKVRATVEGIARQAAREPLRVGTYTADGQQVPMVLSMLMANDRDFARAARTVRVLHDAARGRPVEPNEELAEALGKPDKGTDNGTSLQMAILCGDREAPRDLSWYRRNIEKSRAEAPVFGPLFNAVTPCATWPAKPVEEPVLSGNEAPGLIVQATGDTRTSYANGQGLHRRMPHSRLITLKARVHGVYGLYPNRCVERQVNDYLRTGKLPARDTTCEKDKAAAGGGS